MKQSFNGYEYVANKIRSWFDKNNLVADDVIVTLDVDGFRTNQFASISGWGDDLEWQCDWWEGQPEEAIHIIGFTPVSEVEPIISI